VASLRPSPSLKDEDDQTLWTVDADTQTDVVREPPTEKMLKVNLTDAKYDPVNEAGEKGGPVRLQLVDGQDTTDEDDAIDDCSSQGCSAHLCISRNMLAACE
jgi:hypothetical protein